MISSTVATLECAAQVMPAAITMQSTGSAVIASISTRTLGAVLGRCERIQQDVQRQQHQAETDQDAADILDPRARPGAEGDEAEDEEDGRDRGDVEGQHLNDERGADIGAEHDGERRHQTDQAFGRERTRDQCGGGAALQDRGEAEAGGERLEAVAQRLRQQPPQIGTERAQDAAVDHVQAPQQQRHAAHQVEKNDASHDLALPNLNRGIRLSPNGVGSNALLRSPKALTPARRVRSSSP